jgi:hypothetical protein
MANRFFNPNADTSWSRRSPPPRQVISSDSESEDDADDEDFAPRAPARGRSAPGSAPKKVSRWDAEKKGGGGSSSKISGSRRRRRAREMEASRNKHDRVEKKKRRRIGEDDAPSCGDKKGAAGGDSKSSGRRRRFCDVYVSSSDGEEQEKEVKANKSCRRRLNPKDDSSYGDEVQIIGSSSSGHPDRGEKAPTSGAAAVVKKEGGNGSSSSGLPNRGGKAPISGAAAVVKKEGGNNSSLRHRILENAYTYSSDDKKVYKTPPPPSQRASKSEKDKLFQVPLGLTYKGGFHDAVAHAARRHRWLLVNVQGLDLASLAQNRDVWANDLVAQCVREHFVLWQADAGDDDEKRGAGTEGEEAAKVLSYYKIPRDKVPVVIIVDPVTGQAVGRLHGTDPNDFLVSMGPYTEKRPAFPVIGAAKKSTAAPTSRQEQAPTTVRKPAEQPTSRQEQAPTPVRKPAEQPVAAAVAVAPTDQQPAVCKMRVRLANGRVVAKDFGSQCAVAELFAYCRSEMGTGAAAARPFRLLRFVGAAWVEIRNDSASFESLRLHMSTVCVELV